jgi:GLPGLI family protein
MSFGQNKKTIEVEYGLEFLSDEQIENNARLKLLFEESNEGAKNASFILTIKGHEANFSARTYRGLNADQWETALVLADYESKLYIDNEKSTVFYNNDQGTFEKDKYLISRNMNNNWNINYQDTTTIQGFKCYKATTTEEIIGRNNKRTTNDMVVWFCPELAFPFGPSGYGKLPGLILQLTVNRVSFYVKKINLDRDRKVEVISKGIPISEPDYENLLAAESKRNKGIKD